MENETSVEHQYSLLDPEYQKNYLTRQVDLVVYSPEMDKIHISIPYNSTISQLNGQINLLLKKDPTISIADSKK